MSFTHGQTGGEYKHQLSEDEMPKHDHYEHLMVKGHGAWPELNIDKYGVIVDHMSSSYVTPNQKVNATITNAFVSTENVGGSIKHNNIQPYIVTYFWKRTI